MDASPAKPIESYDELIQALRNRICELGIIFDTVDKIAGLSSRYASHLLSAEPSKRIGPVTLFPILAALGLRLRLEPDRDTAQALGLAQAPAGAVGAVWHRSSLQQRRAIKNSPASLPRSIAGHADLALPLSMLGAGWRWTWSWLGWTLGSP